jgi:hypothetical protein
VHGALDLGAWGALTYLLSRPQGHRSGEEIPQALSRVLTNGPGGDEPRQHHARHLLVVGWGAVTYVVSTWVEL